MSDLVVSLTTIPSRVDTLGDFLAGLERQTLTPDRVELYVPRRYKKRKLGRLRKQDVPAAFEVIECEDMGPATKILPALTRHAPDTRLVYCDDDKVYPPDWLARLAAQGDRYPRACIADEVMSVATQAYRMHATGEDRVGLAERLRRRIAGTNLPPEFCVVAGFGGVLVKPRFFDALVQDIPDVVWTVDDVWLSACLARTGTPIVWTGRADGARAGNIVREGAKVGRRRDALIRYAYKGYDRDSANDYAVRYAIEHLGVWRRFRAARNSAAS
ncbi:hypothetical protein SAMN04490244_106103 [Tranquillimonas rosea]|uniref:Glycosyl transferase family 2 n=1 Tax=Tranquillimonas rosea TaxID=641238 RepID=A0A1H9UYT4_9RHOB|nr:hypothetical protein [Tranquillimonas rosea]SES14582.1 hypothetical protein SAMN04490244_106103 [Tranquillimonas rosea]